MSPLVDRAMSRGIGGLRGSHGSLSAGGWRLSRISRRSDPGFCEVTASPWVLKCVRFCAHSKTEVSFSYSPL